MLIMLKKIILNSLKVAVVGYILITTFSSNGYRVLDQDTAYKQLQIDKSIHLVDVRELHEFNAGHINGAQLIPLGTIEDSFSSLIPQKDTKIFMYEENKKVNIIPCYKDNDLSLKRLLLSELKDYTGLDNPSINLILNICNRDRVKLRNEINKIKIFFKYLSFES